MSRYTPVTSKTQMASEYEHVFDHVMGVFGRVRGPFSMLLHSPELTERLLPMVPFAREICSATPTTFGPRRSTLPVAWACANW